MIRLREYWKRNIYFRLTVVFLIIYMMGTLGIYFFEKRSGNESFNNIYEGFWSTLVYIISGFDVSPPKTFPGRILAIVILIASLGIAGLIIGQITNIIIQGKVIKMSKDIKNHIVICNWSEKGENIILELHSPRAAPDIGIIVLSKPVPSNKEELRMNFTREFSNVEFREASPMSYESLQSANVHMAKAVIILADSKSNEPDSQIGLIALAINTICKKKFNEEVKTDKEYKKPRIIAEVLDHMKMQHLSDAGADDVICATDYAIGIIAQSAINEKLSDIYHDLLTYSEETNEIFILDDPEVSDWIAGKRFEEVSMFFLEHRCDVNPAIPIGFRRGEAVTINPREDVIFNNSDVLIVMAYDIPDIRNIIRSKT